MLLGSNFDSSTKTMKLLQEYNWYSSFVDTDMNWLEDALNWEQVFDLVALEYDLLGILTLSSFANTPCDAAKSAKINSLHIFVALS